MQVVPSSKQKTERKETGCRSKMMAANMCVETEKPKNQKKPNVSCTSSKTWAKENL